ncbi:MAG: DUF389 domain-containing protein [Candidatus Nanopelagicales bacterium]
MAQVVGADIERMQAALYIEGTPMRSSSSSRFWVLLVLAGIIATAGVIADSTATVIGAMIVAPLMTPILGTALAVVLADRVHLVRSVTLVLLGAVAVIAIAYVIGAVGHPLDAYQSNTQVAARINPRIIDLLAALATGTVGAFALVRSDISDALPGVAIAISLVPPLAVVGLLLEVNRFEEAAGALLLFATNFAAIVATGTAVLLAFRIRDIAESAGLPLGALTGRTVALVVASVLLVAIPLTAGTLSVLRDQQLVATATPIARSWAQEKGWAVATVEASGGRVVVTALGPPPEVDPQGLRRELDAAGLETADLQIRLIVGGVRNCPPGALECSYPVVR